MVTMFKEVSVYKMYINMKATCQPVKCL